MKLPDDNPARLIEAFHAGRGGIDTLVALGMECLARGDARTAAAFARAAQFLSPETAAPRLLLGGALVELGEYTGAADVLHEVLHASPGTTKADTLLAFAASGPLSECGARIALGRALAATSRSAEAIAEF